MRPGVLVLALLLFAGRPASAEWQIKPFLGVTFGGGTTFIDLELAGGTPNVVLGVSGVLLGDILGLEADFGRAPGFFQSGDQHLVLGSSATTFTGNLVVALPRRLTEYTLRPYFVGGAGLMHARINNTLPVLQVNNTLAAMDVGGGVTGFVSKRIGFNWDVRWFRSVGGKDQGRGLSLGRPEQLSFWRVNMAVAVRY